METCILNARLLKYISRQLISKTIKVFVQNPLVVIAVCISNEFSLFSPTQLLKHFDIANSKRNPLAKFLSLPAVI